MIHHITNTLHSIGNTINTMVNGSAIGTFLVGLGSAIVAYLTPIKWLLCICFATTIIDMIYGFKVARKQNKKIESGKNWEGTIAKIFNEFVIIALAHGIEWSIFDETGVFLLTGGVTAIITLTELWSIIENLNTIDPDGPWRLLGKFLRKKGEDYTGIELNFDNEHTDNPVVDKEQLEESH